MTWPSARQLKSDKSSTEFTGSKIGLLVKHIADFRAELAKVSAMGQLLELQLEVLSNIINPKKTEAI